MSNIERTTAKVMAMAPGEVDAFVSKLAPTTMQELRRTADGFAQRAVWLSEYLDWRDALGAGDSGHQIAVVHADAKLKEIRRAIGYTYP